MSASAVTTRSTPGNTSAYLARFPSRLGVGKVNGAPTDSTDSSLRTRANGALPPPEKTTSTALARGAIDPSGRRINVGSTDTHPVPRRTRTGTLLTSAVNVPPGSANTVAFSVRCSGNSTRVPLAAACSDAETG